MNLLDDLKYQYKYGSAVIKLVFINVAIFIAIGFLNLFLLLVNTRFEFVSTYLALSGNFSHMLHTPWTILTYQFTHTGFIHLLFNMVMLYFTGKIFEDFFRKQDIWRVYLLGGLAGGLLFILSSFLPAFRQQHSILIGASGSIMAMLFASAGYAPNLRLSLFGLFEIRLIWLAVGYLVIDMISIPSGNAGGHIAHIGGALFGYLFAKYRQGNLQINLLDSFRTPKPDERKFKVKIHTQSPSKKHSNSDNTSHQPTQEDIDIILDKISKNGYDKLSKQEKDILFKASQD